MGLAEMKLVISIMSKGALKTNKELAKIEQQLAKIAKRSKDVTDRTLKARKREIASNKSRMASIQAVNKSVKTMGAAMLSAGLATLFFGMALQKWAMSGLKALINTWTLAMEGTAEYNATVGRLTAAFEFLKFSIADAFLASEFGQTLIETLIGIFDWISSMPAATQVWIAKMLLVTFVIGTLLMLFGIILLFIMGIFIASALVGSVWLLIALGILLIPILILAIIGLLFGVQSGNKKIIKLFSKIVGIIILIGIAILFAIFGPIGLIIALVVILFIGFILGADTMKLVFFHTFNSIKKMFVGLINYIIRGINRLSSMLGFKAIAELTFKESNLDKIAEIEARIKAKSDEKEGLFDKVKTFGKDKMGEMTNNLTVENLNVMAPTDSPQDMMDAAGDTLARLNISGGTSNG